MIYETTNAKKRREQMLIDSELAKALSKARKDTEREYELRRGAVQIDEVDPRLTQAFALIRTVVNDARYSAQSDIVRLISRNLGKVEAEQESD
jgi:hypothetical protein